MVTKVGVFCSLSWASPAGGLLITGIELKREEPAQDVAVKPGPQPSLGQTCEDR